MVRPAVQDRTSRVQPLGPYSEKRRPWEADASLENSIVWWSGSRETDSKQSVSPFKSPGKVSRPNQARVSTLVVEQHR